MDTHFLQRPTGRIGYDVRGSGPLVLCLSGMGDLRSTYRFVAPALADAGFRVACAEPRGHGDSDTDFDSYDDEAAASDLIALVEELGGPALLVGHSMGAAAAIVAAARRPDLVRGLVLLGPFARQPAVNLALRGLLRVLMQPWWVRATWKAYLPSLYAGRHPADHADHLAAVYASLGRPGHARAFSRTVLGTTHDIAEQHLPGVQAPALVVMGELDKDFPDPPRPPGSASDCTPRC